MNNTKVPVLTVTPPNDMTGETSIANLDFYLGIFFEDKAMAHHQWYSEALKKVEKVLNPLLAEIKKRDKRLSFEPMTPRAHFRVLRQNIFEIFIIFKKLDSRKVSVIELDSPESAGEVLVGIKQSKIKHSWFDVIQTTDEGNVLSAAFIREYLNHFLQNISKEKGILQPNVWFDCTNNEQDGLILNISYEGEIFFVHLTPTIFVKDVWPRCAAMWENVMFRWPEEQVRQKLVESGIHVVCRPLKPSTKQAKRNTDIVWSICFLNAEKFLLQDLNTGCRNKCLQIMKTVLDCSLSYPCGLTPHHVETTTLHLNSLMSSPSLWQDTCLNARFLDLLSAVHKSLTQESCSQFFSPSVQLFKDIPSPVLKTLAARIKHIVDHPVEYFKTFCLEDCLTQF